MYSYIDDFGIDMLFYTFDDFYKKRIYLKESFLLKDLKYRRMYGLYIQSRPFIKEYFRGVMWDYLNDYLDEEEMEYEYDKYQHKFNKKVIQ